MQAIITKNDEITVELRAAPIPKPLHKMALHLYFVIHQSNNSKEFNQSKECERWELWQSKNAFQNVLSSDHLNKNKICYGHIHKNLKAPQDGVGGGASYHIKNWTGKEAIRIKQLIYHYNENYHYQNSYLAWPGPNSNTYVSAILEASKIHFKLPEAAIGKDWRGLFLFKRNKETKLFQIQFLTLGFKIIKNNFWEFHFLGLTFGNHPINN